MGLFALYINDNPSLWNRELEGCQGNKEQALDKETKKERALRDESGKSLHCTLSAYKFIAPSLCGTCDEGGE